MLKTRIKELIVVALVICLFTIGFTNVKPEKGEVAGDEDIGFTLFFSNCFDLDCYKIIKFNHLSVESVEYAGDEDIGINPL